MAGRIFGATSGGVATYDVDPSTGALTLAGSASSAHCDGQVVAVSPDGNIIAVSDQTSIETFKVASDGSLTSAGTVSVGSSNYGMGFSASGLSLYSTDLNANVVRMWDVNQASGALTAKSTATLSIPYAHGVCVRPDNAIAIVGSDYGRLYYVAVDPSTEVLSGSPYVGSSYYIQWSPGGSPGLVSLPMAWSGSGDFYFADSYNSDWLHFTSDPTTGALSLADSQSAGSGDGKATYASPAGQSVYLIGSQLIMRSTLSSHALGSPANYTGISFPGDWPMGMAISTDGLRGWFGRENSIYHVLLDPTTGAITSPTSDAFTGGAYAVFYRDVTAGGAPASPTDLAVVSNWARQQTLTWTVSADTHSSQTIYRDGKLFAAIADNTTATLKVVGLRPGEKPVWTVTATNGVGESDPSESASALVSGEVR